MIQKCHPSGWHLDESHVRACGLEALLADTGSLADLVAQIVELCATDAAVTDDVDVVDLGAVHGEGTLDANAEADLADGEGLAVHSAVTTDDVTLEDLNTLALAFLDAVVNLHVVTNEELRQIGAHLLLLNGSHDIHVAVPFLLKWTEDVHW